MSKTTLTTDWICVATSGFTADGREISKQDLKDMAESYNKEEYTSMLWLEHYRWQNFGKVLELKAEDVGEETKLYAKISPSAELINLNGRGQKIFTSIEILPNFNKSGKAYLGGLAITDSPASRGTTELNFSVRGVAEGAILGNPEPFTITQEEVEEEKNSFFNAFFKFLKSEQKQQQTTDFNKQETANNGENPDQEEIEMTNEEIQKFAVAIASETAKACFAQFNTQQTEQKQAEPKEEPKAEQQKEETVSATEFSALKKELAEMTEKFNALEKLAKTETTETPAGVPAVGKDGQFKLTTAI
ncbi:GPO family capsid scaffolding protein [Pasteurella skyensis]|uniref:GPO family capsid scaffolding protein n=1 Tax=Phocoenobacter skyensis TaxID=97481 RepID=A0AAJ6NBD1_9PAST|nr:GPO family capsid scaffolding protein [Pasteurella skyensis]MDP8173671.1 GPO family capsid scaffolding protein [Pasteurella skyensis]MDP8178039.1 GPO family capsid scaffolding protein [Pasteurella skyensis]